MGPEQYLGAGLAASVIANIQWLVSSHSRVGAASLDLCDELRKLVPATTCSVEEPICYHGAVASISCGWGVLLGILGTLLALRCIKCCSSAAPPTPNPTVAMGPAVFNRPALEQPPLPQSGTKRRGSLAHLALRK